MHLAALGDDATGWDPTATLNSIISSAEAQIGQTGQAPTVPTPAPDMTSYLTAKLAEYAGDAAYLLMIGGMAGPMDQPIVAQLKAQQKALNAQIGPISQAANNYQQGVASIGDYWTLLSNLQSLNSFCDAMVMLGARYGIQINQTYTIPSSFMTSLMIGGVVLVGGVYLIATR